METRRMNADEWEAFKSLRLAALEKDGNQFGQSYEVVKGYGDDRWKEDARKAAESDDFFIILTFDGARPVGMSGCVRTKDFGKIIAVWVEPAYRGRGIGRLLVTATMDIVGARRYKLSVVAGNQPAIRTYQGLGFVPTGFSYVNDKGFTEVEMEFNAGTPMLPQDQKQIVRQGYDKLSYAYRSDETPDDYSDYAAWVRILAERLPERAPVLDIGCGCGLPATKLLAERFEVTGVDFSQVQIDRARRLVPSARFVCGDISAQSFPSESFAAVVSFYAIIHMPLAEHPALFRKIAQWLRPSGYLLAIVSHDAWTGTDEAYLGVPGVTMCWSHADEATNVRWIREAGLHVHWTKFVPEGTSGHALVFAQKPPIDQAPTAPSA